MTIAEQAREAARSHPFVYDALRAGVLNYTAAARFLDIGDEEAVAAALRRYGEQLEYDLPAGETRVTMESGLGPVEDDALLTVGETALGPGAGSLTGILATGAVSLELFHRVIGRCVAASLSVHAAGFTEAALLVVVERRDGPEAIQLVEDCCS
jgi:hypothetical protein